MIQETGNRTKPLVVYLNDDGQQMKTYSDYSIEEGVIRIRTSKSIITIPLVRLLKIKEEII